MSLEMIGDIDGLDYGLAERQTCYIIAGEVYIRIGFEAGCVDIVLYEDKAACEDGKVLDKIHYRRYPCDGCIENHNNNHNTTQQSQH